jgi:hypothetical protein
MAALRVERVAIQAKPPATSATTGTPSGKRTVERVASPNATADPARITLGEKRARSVESCQTPNMAPTPRAPRSRP